MQGQEKTSPMMMQWHQCKKQAKEALLFFRLGDFYEAFYQDAQIIAKELGLTLTKRHEIPMCGVPFHTSDNYLDKLVAKGYKVAVAEQTEDPKKTKGLVKREVVRVVSPGTVINSNLLSEKSNNYFASLSQVGMIFGLCIIDLTTSEFKIIEIEEEKELIDELYRVQPKEFLVSEKFTRINPHFFEELSHSFSFVTNKKEDWYFDHQIAQEALLTHFKLHNLDGLGLKGYIPGINAAGAVLQYVKDELHFNIDHIQKIQTDTLSSYMALDYSCMRNLELLESLSRDHKEYCLLGLLDKTQTPMGGRLLKQWIKHPLLCPKTIKERQVAIEELLHNEESMRSTIKHLEKIKDLERLIMKISSGYAMPRDMVALRFSLEVLPLIKNDIDCLHTKIFEEEKKNIKDITQITETIKKALVDQPPLRITDGNTFRDGYDPSLDEVRQISKNSKEWIANYQNELRESTQIKNLKVGFTRVFGYYIEVSKGQTNKIPEYFQRRQTLVNGERFITEELKSFEHKILTSEERIKAIETNLYNDLKLEITEYANDIYTIAKAIAHIDSLFSLALAARSYGYTKPIIDTSDTLNIVKGRHPIIEAFSHIGKFIPNDTHLDNQEQQLFLITGPNMAGKSTYIRQVALIVIMAQIGSFVPAESAHIGIVDKVFTRIGASDDLTKGQSTFMVEMTETANILNNVTEKSLVILDEIGRGTSTYDGISIAWAVAEFLLTNPERKAKTLFATHYWELTELQKELKGALNYHVAVEETASGIVFLRKIVKGQTDKSYGIHVGRLAGLPFRVIKRAEEMLKHLENNANRKQKKVTLRSKNSIDEQLSLFSVKPQTDQHLVQIQNALKNIDINKTSPIEALQKLFDLQQLAKKNEL